MVWFTKVTKALMVDGIVNASNMVQYFRVLLQIRRPKDASSIQIRLKFRFLGCFQSDKRNGNNASRLNIDDFFLRIWIQYADAFSD